MHLLEWMEYLIRVKRTGRIETGPDFDNQGAVKRLDGDRAELTEIGRELLVVLTERLHMEQRITALEADLAAALDELASHKPDERVGQCFCKSQPTQWVSDDLPGVWAVVDDSGDTMIRYFPYCSRCGAHLGEDGVARRNADAARVQRVREALDGFEYEMDCDAGVYRQASAFELRAAIRAALDPPADPEVPDE